MSRIICFFLGHNFVNTAAGNYKYEKCGRCTTTQNWTYED